MSRDDDIEESEQLSSRRSYGRIVYANGNGQLNKVVWAAAGLFVVTLVAMQGFMWKAQIDTSRETLQRIAALEAQMSILLSRQQQ